MRVLVTGSSGRVGAAIARALATQHAVIGLDILPGFHTSHVGSVADYAFVLDAVTGTDAIVHTAALHAPHLDRASPDAFASTNVQGTANILRAAAVHGVSRLVYSSTTSIYGHALVQPDRAAWIDESVEPLPRDIYDETKLQAEGLCREATLAGKVSCVSLRFARCFPEPAHLMAAYRLYRGVDLRDVAEAHRLALQARSVAFEVFNVSARSPFVPSDCRILLADPVSVINARCPGLVDAFLLRGWPLPTSIDRVYAIGKAETHLGYHPRYNCQEFVSGAV